MLKNYYINNSSQYNGDHEVHEEHCTYLRRALDIQYLGKFEDAIQAVAYAKRIYTKADGCFYCCREAHKS